MLQNIQSWVKCDKCGWLHNRVIAHLDRQYNNSASHYIPYLYHIVYKIIHIKASLSLSHIGFSSTRSHTRACIGMYQYKSYISAYKNEVLQLHQPLLCRSSTSPSAAVWWLTGILSGKHSPPNKQRNTNQLNIVHTRIRYHYQSWL